MKKTIELLLFVVLAILLLLCLFHMPYGYYMFVRFVTMLLGAYFAYKSFEEERPAQAIAWIVIAILFQPFFKIALGRTLWNIVDVVVAVFAIYCLYITSKHNREDNN
ncbi:MAG: hypothetical protein J5719_03310 [Bacteroidales bacterium]|nr:hypothetical protein [Bacteroidales bacterium]